MDPVEQAKSEMGSFERAVFGLPGIKGYREKELRRKADKQVRDTLARRLESRRRKLTGLQGDLLAAGGLLWMDDVERIVGRLQLLIDRIKTASYGYAPLWGLNKVKEDDLDRLIAFDQALIDEVAQLDEAIDALEDAVKANEGLKEALAAVGDLLAGLNETFTRRSDVIQNSAQ
ncbi:MAG: hypothetical protein ACUVR4_04365 [Anaerolineae bacterium]